MSLLLEKIQVSDFKTIAKAITLVENRLPGSTSLLAELRAKQHSKVIGITGPPGAGKSSLVNELVKQKIKSGETVAVLAVDPSSPFNYGSILGDRLRMAELFQFPNVYIRSVSSRGSLGGLCAAIIEITEVLRHAGFDSIFIETVGVGQSEVEIAGVADLTIVVLVPESGDTVQTMKSGVMEIGDVFVINKADRAGAEGLKSTLENTLHTSQPAINFEDLPRVLLTSATDRTGIEELNLAVQHCFENKITKNSTKKIQLIADKVLRIISEQRMRNFNKEEFFECLKTEANKPDFNLFHFAQQFYS